MSIEYSEAAISREESRHPLSTLTDENFLSGLGQTINIVTTYGETYSSGELTFGGGDSGELLEKELIEELKKRGKII